ncbi:uncharacterized protein LOC125819371 [Solanum verrucosum]|nr:uncharacterized protein LOC125819371 [Solanum verrucosum]
MYINEPTRVRVRCTVGCPWVLFASFDSRTNNFVVKTYNRVHKCDPTNRNKLCNSKFLSSHYSERIKEQPAIRIFEFQGLIKKELDLYVGRTMCRRARNKVLQELMGDYAFEFGRILDYKDELLRTNPGSTCVVKLHEETFEKGRKMFQGFYICFDAMKKSFLAGCRRCIGLDGCFLKGVSKGQLLVAVCKDGNNQMLPLAWAVVEVENKFTWAWFVKLLKEDLQLGDGTDLTIILDMQKGLEIAITDHLPNVEHRMCARHILANWSKRWRGLERKKCFWSIEWNSDTGYEVLHGPYRHVIDIQRQICSCRACMLKGIPCPHAITALQHRKLDPINYISHWYNRETYIKTYNYFIQPVMNLKMLPESQNISVIPPHVRKMPGRPDKKRKKEQGETSKTGKLSKRGIEMSCNTCHNKGHNKRKCPLGAPASGTSFTAGPSSRPAAGPSSRLPSGPATPSSRPPSGPTAASTST